MDFSLSALGVKEKKSVLFSGKEFQAKKLIELILKKEKNQHNISVLSDSSNYLPLMDSVVFVNSLSGLELNRLSLPELSEKIHSIEKNQKNKGILLFDSISSLLSFNPVNAVYSFLFFETRKAKELNYSVVCFVDERLHDEAVLLNIKEMMDYNFFFEFKGNKLFVELTALPFNSISKNFVFEV
jgi:lysine/ornithine N-monooxygenase